MSHLIRLDQKVLERFFIQSSEGSGKYYAVLSVRVHKFFARTAIIFRKFWVRSFQGQSRTEKQQDNFLRKFYAQVIHGHSAIRASRCQPDTIQIPTLQYPSASPNGHCQCPYTFIKFARFRKCFSQDRHIISTQDGRFWEKGIDQLSNKFHVDA